MPCIASKRLAFLEAGPGALDGARLFSGRGGQAESFDDGGLVAERKTTRMLSPSVHILHFDPYNGCPYPSDLSVIHKLGGHTTLTAHAFSSWSHT